MTRFLSLFAALALTAPAWAQTAEPPSAGGPHGAFGATAVRDLIGLDVRESSGADIGEVEALVRADGVVQAVIGVGGFLGFGEHTVAVPLSQFVMTETGLTLPDLSEAQLRGMATHDEGLEALPEDITVAGDPLPGAAESVAPTE